MGLVASVAPVWTRPDANACAGCCWFERWCVPGADGSYAQAALTRFRCVMLVLDVLSSQMLLQVHGVAACIEACAFASD